MKVMTRQQQTDFVSVYYYEYSVFIWKICIVHWNEEQFFDKWWNWTSRRSAKHWFAFKWPKKKKKHHSKLKMNTDLFLTFTSLSTNQNQTDMRAWMKIIEPISNAQTTELSMLKFFYMICELAMFSILSLANVTYYMIYIIHTWWRSVNSNEFISMISKCLGWCKNPIWIEPWNVCEYAGFL